jgi:restriction endonuclease S subunit
MTEWKMVKLGDIAEVLRGSTITRKEVTPGEVPVIAGGQTPSCYHNVSNREGNTITVSASGAYAGYVQYFEIPIFASDCSTIKVKDEHKFSPKFLFYMLQASQRDIYEFQRGSGQPHVYPSQLVGLSVPAPSIDEQHKIVEILEDHLSRLDAALADVKQAKVKAAQFRRSLLLSLVWPEYVESKDDWTRTTLGRVCQLVAGKTPSALERSIEGIDEHSRTVPFYKVGDMNLDPEFLCKSRLYLSEKQIEERNMFVLPIGSVVFPKAGGAIATNKKRIVSVPGPIDLNCMAAIPIQGTIPKYLYWWFQSINLETFADGSILPQLSKGKMSEIPLYWPNPDIQEEVLMKLEQALSKNSQAIQLAELIEANSNSLRRSLLQAAFTGRLTEEVASV